MSGRLEVDTESIGFLVHERAVGVFGIGLEESTSAFARSVNGKYWEHQLLLLKSVPPKEVSGSHAAFARQAVSHVDEHVFALIFAFLQAPYCPDLWLYHYKSDELYSLVEKIFLGQPIPTLIPLKETSWEGIVRVIWPQMNAEHVRLTSALLTRHALRIVNKSQRDEYNGLKHGLRATLGSFKVSFAEGVPDKRPEPEEYVTLGESEHGCHHLVFSKVAGSKNNFIGNTRSANWDIHELVAAIEHSILFVKNLGTAMAHFLGLEQDYEILIYSNADAYLHGNRIQKGVYSMERDIKFDIPPQSHYSDERVRKDYKLSGPRKASSDSA